MKKFLTISCLGCGGLLLLAGITLALIGWVGSRRATFTDATASYEPLTVQDVEASADLGEAPPSSGEPATPEGTMPAVNRVTLSLGGVDEAKIRPCAPGEPMRVDATYDEKRTEFAETMTSADDGSWSYAVEMEGSGSELTRLLQRIFGGRKSTLDFCIPSDVPVELELEVARGGVEAELGGLWISGAEVSVLMGGGFVNFGEPLREPAGYLTFRANMGGGMVAGIGNASPSELSIENSMGGFTADLSGAWQGDALIRVESSQGGTTLLLPRAVRVEGAPGVTNAAGLSEAVPVLRFEPGTDFEEITIQQR